MSPGKPPAPSEHGTAEQVQTARAVLRPATLAGNTVAAFVATETPLDIVALSAVLHEQGVLANSGDLKRAEAMLIVQAHTLDALFNSLACRAARNLGEYIEAADTYIRLALRAQSQCRATLETLAVLKNPAQPTFIRQANVAHGPQQVNNAEPAALPPPTPDPIVTATLSATVDSLARVSNSKSGKTD